MCTLGSDIYVFGGVHDRFDVDKYQSHDDLYRFDTESDTWTQVYPEGPAPSPRAFVTPVSYEEQQKFLIFGGALYHSETRLESFDDVWSYSVTDNAWSRIESEGPRPSTRACPTIWRVGEKVYLFGGISLEAFQDYNDLWSYDPTENRWEELIPNDREDAPPRRLIAAGGKRPLDGKLFIYGGEYMNSATASVDFYSDTWKLTIDTLQWERVTSASGQPSPQRQVYAAAEVLGDYFYLFGGDEFYEKPLPGFLKGEGGSPYPEHPSNKLWRFDPKSEDWMQLHPDGDPMVATKRLSSTAVNGAMFVYGGFGWNYPGQNWNTNIYSYQPEL